MSKCDSSGLVQNMSISMLLIEGVIMGSKSF